MKIPDLLPLLKSVKKLLLLRETKIHIPVILLGESLNNKRKLKTLEDKNRRKLFRQLATNIQEQSFADVPQNSCS